MTKQQIEEPNDWPCPYCGHFVTFSEIQHDDEFGWICDDCLKENKIKGQEVSNAKNK